LASSSSCLKLSEKSIDIHFVWSCFANLPVSVVDEVLLKLFRYNQIDLL